MGGGSGECNADIGLNPHPRRCHGGIYDQPKSPHGGLGHNRSLYSRILGIIRRPYDYFRIVGYAPAYDRPADKALSDPIAGRSHFCEGIHHEISNAEQAGEARGEKAKRPSDSAGAYVTLLAAPTQPQEKAPSRVGDKVSHCSVLSPVHSPSSTQSSSSGARLFAACSARHGL